MDELKAYVSSPWLSFFDNALSETGGINFTVLDFPALEEPHDSDSEEPHDSDSEEPIESVSDELDECLSEEPIESVSDELDECLSEEPDERVPERMDALQCPTCGHACASPGKLRLVQYDPFHIFRLTARLESTTGRSMKSHIGVQIALTPVAIPRIWHATGRVNTQASRMCNSIAPSRHATAHSHVKTIVTATCEPDTLHLTNRTTANDDDDNRDPFHNRIHLA
ncbi:hypothetical protein IQ07DRAFT_677245 [Pyrenochaeta sp. DS3sAY3a]|nr:hypothetical protein IQ07DRAFT_677245 [Pyrenochaeta sp. DS3sAY3a]